MISRKTVIIGILIVVAIVAGLVLVGARDQSASGCAAAQNESNSGPLLKRVHPRYAVYLPQHLASAALDAAEGTKYLANPSIWPHSKVDKEVHGEYNWIPAVHEDSLHDPYDVSDRSCSYYQPKILCPETDEEEMLNRASKTCEHVLPQAGTFMR